MQTRAVIIAVSILIVIAIIGGIWFLLQPSQSTTKAILGGASPENSTSMSPGLPAPVIINFPNEPQAATFAIGTPNGLVTVKNFYKLPVVADEEYLILENTNDYQITYDTMTGQFFVYASSTPLDVARQEGEAAFLQLLGITQGDACKLNVAEGFPQGSPSANNQPGLSFCGGAFQAP